MEKFILSALICFAMAVLNIPGIKAGNIFSKISFWGCVICAVICLMRPLWY